MTIYISITVSTCDHLHTERGVVEIVFFFFLSFNEQISCKTNINVNSKSSHCGMAVTLPTSDLAFNESEYLV